MSVRGCCDHALCVLVPFPFPLVALVQGWRTYGKRAKNGMRHSPLSKLLFISPTQSASLYFDEYMYVYIYTHI